MADAHSPYRPYFDALPPARELVCPLVMLPSAYLPLLANADAVSTSPPGKVELQRCQRAQRLGGFGAACLCVADRVQCRA